MLSIVLLLASLLSSATSKHYPITDRDEYNEDAASLTDHPIKNDPEVFKCRAISNGKRFDFAHEWIHLSATANCNLILLEGKYNEQQWSDIVHQTYRLQNHYEHIPHSEEDNTIYPINSKLAVLRVFAQRYLVGFNFCSLALKQLLFNTY